MQGTVDSSSSIASSWNVTIPTNSQTTAGWAAYDLWFNNWADEVMIQTDIVANSNYNCTASTSATFNGMPWHMCQFGSERVWKPGTDDTHLRNETTGSVDVRSMLTWMEQHGICPLKALGPVPVSASRYAIPADKMQNLQSTDSRGQLNKGRDRLSIKIYYGYRFSYIMFGNYACIR